jgi:hypothetical protein
LVDVRWHKQPSVRYAGDALVSQSSASVSGAADVTVT